MIRTLELAVRSLTKESKHIEIRLKGKDYTALTKSLANDNIVKGRGFGEYRIGNCNLIVKKIK
jgi:hypothetical protein